MNYLNRASRCCLRQNLHTFTCFCIITVELSGGDCNEKRRVPTRKTISSEVTSLNSYETVRHAGGIRCRPYGDSRGSNFSE